MKKIWFCIYRKFPQSTGYCDNVDRTSLLSLANTVQMGIEPYRQGHLFLILRNFNALVQSSKISRAIAAHTLLWLI